VIVFSARIGDELGHARRRGEPQPRDLVGRSVLASAPRRAAIGPAGGDVGPIFAGVGQGGVAQLMECPARGSLTEELGGPTV
jgi:hypothetical protein